MSVWRRGLATAVVVAGMLSGSAVRGQCLAPPGDLTDDGVTTVTDVQCAVLVSMWNLAGQQGALPQCLAGGWTRADLNCDHYPNVTDVVLDVKMALGLSLGPELDANQDGCPDACTRDSDADGQPDYTDCAPLLPEVHAGATEVCNGYDDDCDGIIDNPGSVAPAASCSDGDVCNGEEACAPVSVPGPVVITEIMRAPVTSPESAGEWIELFNPGTQPVDLDGWTLRDDGGDAHVIDNNGPLRVPPGGFLVLGGSKDVNVNGGVIVDYAWSAFTLDNGFDEVILEKPDGTVADAVHYGVIGWPALIGVSMAVVDPSADNDQPGAWAASTTAFGIGQGGTPGGPNLDVSTVDPCVAGQPLDCTVNNPCVVASCDPVQGCVTSNASGPCDDGDACTSGDACAGGACVGSPVDCNDGNQCTADGCDPATGCTHQPLDQACTDGDACTFDEWCIGGTCVPGSSLNCNDSNPCTDDVCDPATGCSHVANAAPCDDGNACTTGDTCSGGGCVGGPAPNCDDGNPCTDDACDALAGCLHTFNTAPCNDGDPCTPTDACSGGVCQGTGLLDCNDNNVCTDDVCVPGQGCQHTPNSYQEPCYTGPPGTQDVGACRGGLRTCKAGELGACAGEVTPTIEVCDSVDNDCDSQTDEGNVCCKALGQACASASECCGGICNETCCVQSCPADGWVCNGNTAQNVDWYCDGTGACASTIIASNNCGTSGFANNFQCQGQTLQQQWVERGCSGGSCYETPSWKNQATCNGTCGSWCVSGIGSCSAAPSGTQAAGCPADGWYCNGINREYRDYFCNGSGGCTYSVTQSQSGGGACTIPGLKGPCAQGQQQCAGGQFQCVQTTFPSGEVCDGVDNNCNGQVDEGGVCPPKHLYARAMSWQDGSICTAQNGYWSWAHKTCYYWTATPPSGASLVQSVISTGPLPNPFTLQWDEGSVCSWFGGQWSWSSNQCYYNGHAYYASLQGDEGAVCTWAGGNWSYSSNKCFTKYRTIWATSLHSDEGAVCTWTGGNWSYSSNRCYHYYDD